MFDRGSLVPWIFSDPFNMLAIGMVIVNETQLHMLCQMDQVESWHLWGYPHTIETTNECGEQQMLRVKHGSHVWYPCPRKLAKCPMISPPKLTMQTLCEHSCELPQQPQGSCAASSSLPPSSNLKGQQTTAP